MDDKLPTAMLEVKVVSGGYGKARVLQGISLTANRGKLTAIVGINGSGKTTLLRCVSSLVPVQKGKIVFEGADITNWSSRRIVQHGLIHVPEGYHIFAPLTVEENLLIGCYAKKQLSHADRNKQLKFVFELFPVLQQRLKQRGDTLSGGEKQMLAVGRGLMGMPNLLMLDEPSTGLAPIVIDKLGDAIMTINKEGITTLLVEQNAHLTMKLADYIYIMENGQVIKQGQCSTMESQEIEKMCLGT